jgi:hypothetical protein
MTEEDDLLLEALAHLRPIASDVKRDVHVLERCHAAIARRAFRLGKGLTGLSGRRLFDLAAAAALCLYLAAAITEAVRMGGSF